MPRHKYKLKINLEATDRNITLTNINQHQEGIEKEVKYHHLTKLRLWLLATILETSPEDLSYCLIAEQESKTIGTALHKLYFLQHPVVIIRNSSFINLYTPIHPYPNKVMGMDFLETRLKAHPEKLWIFFS